MGEAVADESLGRSGGFTTFWSRTSELGRIDTSAPVSTRAGIHPEVAYKGTKNTAEHERTEASHEMTIVKQNEKIAVC